MRVHVAPALDATADESPFEAARVSRGMSREDAAERAALGTDEIAWLEDGRLYRFRSPQEALAAAAVYTAALRIDQREALALAGRPVPPADPARTGPRLLAAAAVVLVFVALTAALAVPRLRAPDEGAPKTSLPPPWRVSVDVLNGGGDIEHTRDVADRVQALSYDLKRVRRASRFDYPDTVVYYPPGAKALADRLAGQLCVRAKPLPGGANKRRLVVIVGPPAAVPDC